MAHATGYLRRHRTDPEENDEADPSEGGPLGRMGRPGRPKLVEIQEGAACLCGPLSM